MNIAGAAKYIKENVNIYDYITNFYNISFKKVGNSYKTMCMLSNHDKDTPSFSIPENENYFKCFGCGESGNLIKFVELYENLDNTDAIKSICNNIGIDLNNEISSSHVRKVTSNKDRSLKFAYNLINTNKEAFEYLKDVRKISVPIMQEFKLGATTNDMEKEYLRNRIVFPIEHNGVKDTILAFAYGYVNDSSKYQAKYINDKTSNIFKKSELFYGYNQAYMYIKASKKVYIVEGYFDVLSMHQSGIKNTVGTMCAALSDNHIETLKRINCEVVLFFDSDYAGNEGKLNSIQRLLDAGLKVKIIDTKYTKDADELCNKLKHDKETIIDFLDKNEKDGILYFIRNDIEEYQNKVMSMRINISKKVAPLLDTLSDVERKIYLDHINNILGI